MAKKTQVTFVLDETGSMESIKDDTIGGFNQYLKGLQEAKDPIFFTLLKFDSNRVETVCNGVPVGEVKPLNADTYRPGAATPLIDACYKAIIATAEKVAGRKRNVTIAIQTDGHENASREYSREQLVDLIKEKTKAGWVFVFLGAGIDAFSQAASFGISRDTTMTYDRDRSGETFVAMAANTASYASTGDAASMQFSDVQRRATGGHMPDKQPAGSFDNLTSAERRTQKKTEDADEVSGQS